MPTPTPRFRELDRAECLAILQRHFVGRMAFARKDGVDIEPIHYVLDDGWLYGRTQPGTKLEALTHNRWVALEVDEVEEDEFEVFVPLRRSHNYYGNNFVPAGHP